MNGKLRKGASMYTWGMSGYEVTDPVLAAHLARRGWRLCGVTEVTQTWPISRQREAYLVFHFADSPELRAAVKNYQESWEGWEIVKRPKRKRRGHADAV